jgi:hypothetical protein
MSDILVVLAVSATGAIGYLIAEARGAAWAVLIGGTVAILSWILWPTNRNQ